MWAFLSIAVVALAAWDARRRSLAAQSRLTSELGEQVTKLVERQRLAEKAHEAFLQQMAAMVGYSEAKKRELEFKLASRKL